MWNEGQKKQKNTSDIENKHPWEIFPEYEIKAIKNNKKHIDKYKKDRPRLIKNKVKFFILAAVIFLAVVCTFGGNYFLNIINSRDGESLEELDDSNQELTQNPYELLKLTLKNAPSPAIAHRSAVMKIKPILTEGIFDSGTINFSKIEDNYEAFAKTLDTDYEKNCYYLAMIDIMFIFNSDFGSARAAYLLDRFDEKKIKFDNTQEYFYLISSLDRAIYRKNNDEINHHRDELERKYPNSYSYLNYETGKLIDNNEELNKIKKGFDANDSEKDNE